jgi:hypothetical protein
MREGAAKYTPYNWRKYKVRTMIYVGSALRHIMAYVDGEEVASDSRIPHIAHALACLGILADATEGNFLYDDRPARGAASKVLAKFDRTKVS